MNFFIVDDTATIRGMLSNIIEEEGLGTVVGRSTGWLRMSMPMPYLPSKSIS